MGIIQPVPLQPLGLWEPLTVFNSIGDSYGKECWKYWLSCPVIFLLVFNPILQKLQENSHKGYKLGDTFHVTTPYADNFCLISTRSTSHQKLINEIHTQISSMGMKLKPSKCTLFSLSAGRPEVIPFHIVNNNIASIKDQEQKFLGKLLFFRVKSEETYSHIKKHISGRHC